MLFFNGCSSVSSFKNIFYLFVLFMHNQQRATFTCYQPASITCITDSLLFHESVTVKVLGFLLIM